MSCETKEQTVLRLLADCRRYNLSGLDLLLSHPFNEIVAAYNGIGPESFPEPLRKALDRLSSQILPAVLIHDCRFTFGDGSIEWFRAANDEFKENGLKIARSLYKWYDPRRYITCYRVRVYANLCRRFGWEAYLKACNSDTITKNNACFAINRG